MDLKLPRLGEGAESGTVVSILVKEGDSVTEGQTLIELENEKAVAPIPSTCAGTIAKLSVKEGDKISVGQTIATINESGASAASTAAPSAARKPAAVRRPEPEPESEAEPEVEAVEAPDEESDQV